MAEIIHLPARDIRTAIHMNRTMQDRKVIEIYEAALNEIRNSPGFAVERSKDELIQMVSHAWGIAVKAIYDAEKVCDFYNQ